VNVARPIVAMARPTSMSGLRPVRGNGPFAGLSGLFLATTLHDPSHALCGATLFLVFSAGVR
jgi:hypothetical protein